MAELVILGSAQDGGVPHAGCLCGNCQAARADHRQRRLPAALGIRDGDAWTLVDATSAFEEQLHMLWSRRPASEQHAAERYLPPELLLLSHAHTGHYAGLWQLDRSVLAASSVLVLAPPLTAAFLMAQEPWAAMIAEGFIRIEAFAWDEAFSLFGDLSVTPIEVPHRAEWETDTAAFLIRGASGSALYLPDIDSWDAWDRGLVETVQSVDLAILDGTFWSTPTSRLVPHPPIIQSMDRLAAVAERGETRIVFTHLNHSNPALTPDSPEHAEVARRGFSIAREGDAIEM